MNTQKIFDSIYSFIEKYFYFIVVSIVIALVSLTASLYAQGNPPKRIDTSVPQLKPFESKYLKEKLYKYKYIDKETSNKIGWSKVAKRYKMEVRCAKPKLT